MWIEISYVSEYYTSFLPDLWLVIVIDLEPREENLVLICCQRALNIDIIRPNLYATFSHDIEEKLTASSFSALFGSNPPICINDQNVVLYRLLM